MTVNGALDYRRVIRRIEVPIQFGPMLTPWSDVFTSLSGR